jgi:hypothetical protein
MTLRELMKSTDKVDNEVKKETNTSNEEKNED